MDKKQRAARKHIESIRRDYLGPDPDDRSGLFDVVSGALRIISEKVHHKDCHFLHELIQNFDDTSYEGVDEPSIEFELTNTHFYAWSNEDGFSKEDVDSICNIGHSSKENDLESTGENGIGFKSVFKIADQVTISSYPYCFSFDTTSDCGKLGMLVPTWVDEPTDARDGTLLTFRLKEENRIRPALSKQLKDFDFYSLLFSRILRKIKIIRKVQGSSITTEATLEGDIETETKLAIKRSDGTRTTEKFVMWNYSTEMNTRARTRNWLTNIRLAFPIIGESDVGQHRIKSHRTYGFQAIQDFGFSFMIHADFILDASRSHVEPDQDWNVELGRCISVAVVDAFRWLAQDEDSPIPLTWPSYINCLERIHDIYFRAIASRIKQKLRGARLIKTDTDTSVGTPMFRCPPDVTVVASDFRRNGRPLLDHSKMLSKVVSSEYPQDILHSLTLLGVSRMGYPSFSKEFAAVVGRYPQYFRRKPESWHSAVAKVLLRHPFPGALRHDLRSRVIVPLHDGTWTQPKAANTFLPDDTGLPIPSGLPIRTVASLASKDVSRRRLFKQLGLWKCSSPEVHRIILQRHRSQTWSEEQLLEQAAYLFLSGFNPRNELFTFANSRCTATSKELIFLPRSKAEFLHPLFETDPHISWLHEDYRSPPSIENGLKKQWASWLRRWKNIKADLPVMRANGGLSMALEDLCDRRGSKKVLEVLQSTSGLPLHNSTWCKNVGKLEVATTHGLRELCETALSNLRDEARGMVPLISLEPSDSDWTFLRHFGVCISVDNEFLFRQLDYLKAHKPAADFHASIKKVYSGLGELAGDDREKSKIRNTFQDARLIVAQDGKWYEAREVRWDSKFEYTRQPVLRDQYKTCRRLFITIMKLRSTDLSDLIDEIRYQSEQIVVTQEPKAVVETMRNLLQHLDNFLESGRPESTISELKALKMFPVATFEGEWTLHSARSGEFWIPDISVLHECFWGHAPLLDLTGRADGANISNIVSVLGLESRLLTKAVQDDLDDEPEEGRADPQLARDLKRKVIYIEGILTAEGHDPAKVALLLDRIRNLKVFRMPRFHVRRYVNGRKRQYEGEKAEGYLRVIINNTSLMILLRDDMKQQHMPRHLRKEMARCLEVSKHSDLLGDLLAADDPESLREDLQRAGAYPTDITDTDSRQRNGASTSTEVNSDSEASGTPSHNARLQKQKHATSKRKTHGLVASGVSHAGQPGMEAVALALEDMHHAADSVASDPGSDTTPRTDSIAPAARAATPLTPSSSSSPSEEIGSGSEARSTGFVDDSDANDSDADVLASSLKKVSMSDDGFNSIISQHSSGVDRPPTSPSPVGNSSGKRRYRAPGSFGRRLSPWAHASGGRPQHLHRRSWDGGSRPSQPGPSSDRKKEIGRKGEHILFQFLKRQLGPSFGERHWTSNGSKYYIPNSCADHRPTPCPVDCRHYYHIPEGNYADFTIADPDASQAFTKYLRDNWLWTKSVDENTNYHLEVKSTPSRVEEDTWWILSPNQVRMARKCSVATATMSEPLRDVYVLIRVFDIERDPKLWFVVDPWNSSALSVVSAMEMKPAYVLGMNDLQSAGNTA